MRSLLDFYTMARPGWPPLNVIVYQVLLLVCWAHALVRGGAPERIGATILVAGSYLTMAAASVFHTRFRSVEVWDIDGRPPLRGGFSGARTTR